MQPSPVTWRTIRTFTATWPRGTRRHKPSRAHKGAGKRIAMSVSSRRSFLKAAGTVSAAACVGTRFASGAGKHVPVGLQLYSVREQLPKDFDGTLHSLSEVGIQVVEAAGYFHKT